MMLHRKLFGVFLSAGSRSRFSGFNTAAGTTMVDFDGWDMPVQRPSGIVAEHLYTFDVSHMGRPVTEDSQRPEYLQYVLTSNMAALKMNGAQYCMIPNENGGAIDDARRETFTYLLFFSHSVAQWA